ECRLHLPPAVAPAPGPLDDVLDRAGSGVEGALHVREDQSPLFVTPALLEAVEEVLTEALLRAWGLDAQGGEEVLALRALDLGKVHDPPGGRRTPTRAQARGEPRGARGLPVDQVAADQGVNIHLLAFRPTGSATSCASTAPSPGRSGLDGQCQPFSGE